MSPDRIHTIKKNGYFLTNHRSCYRRGVLWLGQTCNQRCSFCYFADAIESKNHPEHEFAPFDKAVTMCNTLRQTYNNNSVDIQGGEPTIYPRILDLVKHCSTIGLKPTLISNALVLENIDTCKKYKDAGIFDFLISVHNIGDDHDRTVGVPGAHQRQMRALDNLAKLDIPFRFNTVLTNEVIDNLPIIAKIAIDKGARTCNFIGFNLSLDQLKRRTKDNVTPNNRIKIALPPIIDLLDSHEIEVNIRYLPFCMFDENHRKYVQNTKQTMYDLHEWEYAGRLWTQSAAQKEAKKELDPPVNIFRFLQAKRADRKGKIADYFKANPDRLLIVPPIKEAPDYQKTMGQDTSGYQPLFYKDSLGPCENFSLFDYAYAEVREITTSEFRYRKLEKCHGCNLTGICDGFQKDYIDFWTDEEAQPEKSIGQIVYDPNYYMKDQMKVVEESEADWALPAHGKPDLVFSKENTMAKDENTALLELPLVSLIVTSYNYSDFIVDCLRGISEQTYRPIECIIVDDCSTDDSVSKINQFIAANSESDITFKLIEHQENQGQLGGFLTGIKEAKGKFIGFVDADDIILPEFINTHIQAHFKTNVAMTVSQQIEFDEDNHIHSLFSLASPQHQPIAEGSFDTVSFPDLSQLVQSKKFSGETINCKVITAETHKFGGWHWGPTSNVVFRKKALMFFSHVENLSYWRYCADNLLFNYAHLIGGSCIVYAPLTAYRRHANKGFSNCSITGSIRYFNQKSRDKITADKEALLQDILTLFVNARQDVLQFMDKQAFKNMIKLITKHYDKNKLLPYFHLLEQLLDKQDLEKI